MEKKLERKVSIIEDEQGTKTVLIHDAIFRGRSPIDWKFVEEYLKNYIGESFDILEYNEKIFIGNDLPDEYTGSNYTESLRGTLAKAKANAIVGIPEMINIATNETYSPNLKDKHSKRAQNGWYRYETQFALPVYNNNGQLERYNIWTADLIVNSSANGKKYLYDIIRIKKE